MRDAITIERKIVLLSFAAGLVCWVLDAAIDALLVGQGASSDRWFLVVSRHEAFSRSLISIGVVLFGLRGVLI